MTYPLGRAVPQITATQLGSVPVGKKVRKIRLRPNLRYGHISGFFFEKATQDVPYVQLDRLWGILKLIPVFEIAYIGDYQQACDFDNIRSKEHNMMYLLFIAEALRHEGL